MNSKTVVSADYPSEQTIAEWKKNHCTGSQSLSLVEVDDHKIIFRPFGVKDLERAQCSDPKGDKPYNFHRSIIANCALWHTPGIMEDDNRQMALFAKIDELNVKTEAILKKI